MASLFGKNILSAIAATIVGDKVTMPAAESNEQNWIDLSSHLRDKVLKRTSEVTFLHTKAGFLIAAGAVLLQIITGLPKFNHPTTITAYVLAIALALASIIVAIVSMHISKSPTPLNPEEMLLTLTEQPKMTRTVFANWLAKSYAQANKEFNKAYSRKYTQQVIAAILLVISFGIVIILKGVSIYA